MKTLLAMVSLCCLAMASCGSSDSQAMGDTKAPGDPNAKTTIQWIDSARNYGKITEGQKLAVSFRFRNTGDKPLVIESVTPACGCTVADYPKQPVPPGGEGEITGAFDSKGREGLQHKELTVKTNTAGFGEHTLFFEVDVVGQAAGQKNSSTN